MKILITGAGGFIGRPLARALAATGKHEVVSFDMPGTDILEGNVAIAGDLSTAADRRRALGTGVDILYHLAAVPGGLAERDPDLSRRVNLSATLDLFEEAAALGPVRIVYTSTIAVLGDPLPAIVDDETRKAPKLVYGAHKLMVEIALADMHRRGVATAIGVRLPGVIARPAGASGLKSAFMSDVFHALASRQPFVSPVSPEATLWLMSVERVVDNLLLAAVIDPATLPDSRVVTLPSLRVTMADLVAAITAHVGGPDTTTYDADAALERAFGTHPPLVAAAAERAGFRNDGSVADLVARVLARLDATGSRV